MDRLRATFIAGPRSGLTAQETFTNRLGEVEAFHLAFIENAKYVKQTDSQATLDIATPRKNVLVYYGLGGVGKTALSKQLQRLVEDRSIADTEVPEKVATVRLDFGEAGDFDLESTLLTLRASLGKLQRRWPAFDLAFSLYWDRTHPGESLPDYVRHNSAIRQHAEQWDIGEEIHDTLGEVLAELGLAWTPSRIAMRLASITTDRLLGSMKYKRFVDRCPFFEPIVTAEPISDALSYMPSLLAWDFDELTGSSPAQAVVFIDTFEAITGNSRELERIIQRLIFLMPKMLFVVTSRNRLDWTELPPTRDLDYVGTERWPLLHSENLDNEPRQHLVGALSEGDCEQYLCHVLQNDDGTPVLDPEIRTRIIEGSDGLPLYLDLSVTEYLESQAAGRSIDASDFGGPLSAVVVRIMRNLNQEERSILRGVSLLDSFDADLARVVSGSSDAVAGRFVNCSLVVRSSELAWPYTLHALLRRTIQECDGELADAWSEREWHLAARRACDHFGELYIEAHRARDRWKVAGCFSQAVRIAARFEFLPTWLLDAAQFLADSGMWGTLDVRLSRDYGVDSSVASVVNGLRGIALRRTGSLDASVRCFDEALAAPGVDDKARSLLSLHRAHSVRNSGKYDCARSEYERLVAMEDPYADRAALQLADIHLLSGRFREALRALDELPTTPDIQGESLRIRGHVYRANGDMDTAELVYRRALDQGLLDASPALEGKARTNLAETLCWTDPTRANSLAEEAIEFNRQLGNQLEVGKALAAKAVAAPGGEEAEGSIREAIRLARASGYRAGEVFALAARFFHQVLSAEDWEDTRGEILSLVSALGVYWYWMQICNWWVGRNVDGDAANGEVEPDWLGGTGRARDQWMGVLRLRKELRG